MTKRHGRTIILGTALLFSLNITAGAAELAGSEWRPAKIGGVELASDSGVFLGFAGDGRVTGHGGCNSFFGSYKLADGAIQFDDLGGTRMACSQPVMDRESSFMKALAEAKTFVRDGTTLTLSDGTGKASVSFVQADWD